jgi:hypothetical protein
MPPPIVPRTRRRTTIFQVRDEAGEQTVRIPRRTAPPEPCGRAARLSICNAPKYKEEVYQGFADGSDSDALTPLSGNSQASSRACSPRSEDAIAAQEPVMPVTSPDGIAIYVNGAEAPSSVSNGSVEHCLVADPQLSRAPRRSQVLMTVN